jgi:hypothetical protein
MIHTTIFRRTVSLISAIFGGHRINERVGGDLNQSSVNCPIQSQCGISANCLFQFQPADEFADKAILRD